ncbi:MAG: hypothetical protein H6721_31445 [Sandaracinus sp.]|nr:hypothetical protein [Sandaracinus sp.]
MPTRVSEHVDARRARRERLAEAEALRAALGAETFALDERRAAEMRFELESVARAAGHADTPVRAKAPSRWIVAAAACVLVATGAVLWRATNPASMEDSAEVARRVRGARERGRLRASKRGCRRGA